MKLGNVYFLVKDVQKSVEFYTELLGKPPKNVETHQGIMRWADWGRHGHFALLSAQAVAPAKVVYGNNAVLNLYADSLKLSYEKIKEMGAKIIQEITVVHEQPYHYSCSMIEDLDGNLIEIAHWKK